VASNTPAMAAAAPTMTVLPAADIPVLPEVVAPDVVVFVVLPEDEAEGDEAAVV
jgi:hypothetical protein